MLLTRRCGKSAEPVNTALELVFTKTKKGCGEQRALISVQELLLTDIILHTFNAIHDEFQLLAG